MFISCTVRAVRHFLTLQTQTVQGWIRNRETDSQTCKINKHWMGKTETSRVIGMVETDLWVSLKAKSRDSLRIPVKVEILVSYYWFCSVQRWNLACNQATAHKSLIQSQWNINESTAERRNRILLRKLLRARWIKKKNKERGMNFMTRLNFSASRRVMRPKGAIQSYVFGWRSRGRAKGSCQNRFYESSSVD